jgi:hypothetical protein
MHGLTFDTSAAAGHGGLTGYRDRLAAIDTVICSLFLPSLALMGGQGIGLELFVDTLGAINIVRHGNPLKPSAGLRYR